MAPLFTLSIAFAKLRSSTTTSLGESRSSSLPEEARTSSGTCTMPVALRLQRHG